MDDLQLTEHRSLIEDLVAKHIDARIEFVKSKEEIDGKLGRALWATQLRYLLSNFLNGLPAKK